MQVSFPAYIDRLPEGEQSIHRCRFLIRLAALYYSPENSVKALSEALGFHPNSLAGAATITPNLAIDLEALLGVDRFPRGLFRPDLWPAVEA